jgi:hypothetical protein
MHERHSRSHISNSDKLEAEIQVEPLKTALARAGFGKSDPEFIDLFIQNFRRMAGRMRW